MKRLCCALIALAVVAGTDFGGLAGQARAQDFPRFFDSSPRERVVRERRIEDEDDDPYFRQRLRYYRRDAVARREAERRRRIPSAAERSQPNFLERLFGASEDEDEPIERRTIRRIPGGVEVRPAPRVVRRKPPADPARAPLAATSPVIAQPTSPPAVAVQPTTFAAVFGDTIADGLANGLAEGFADTPEFAVRKHVKPNAGLVRADYFDFVEEAKKAVAGEKIDFAIVDVGVNDRQPFLDMRQELPLSPAWIKRYGERIDAMLAAFAEKKVPVYWIGLAPSESRKATADHTALNVLIKDKVEAAGGIYVDVWEGFVDEDGRYMAYGPQLDGQPGRLRLDDGVHFSKSGSRKLAHYVEREIRKVFQSKPPAPEAIIGAVAPDASALPQAAPAEAERPRPLASPLIVLTAPRRTDGGALAAASLPIPARDASPQAERVLVKGEALDADAGRLDDHRWPGATPALASQPVSPALLLDQAAPPAEPPAAPAPFGAVQGLMDPRPTAQQPGFR